MARLSNIMEEEYVYCSMPKDIPFPKVPELDKEWYTKSNYGQLEFRKWSGAKTWSMQAALYFPDYKEFRLPVEIPDVDVLDIWLQVVKAGGVVSDGIHNLFGK